ncbi:MAG: hypothetical protein ACYS0K_24260 [Planctomycetota bacterium]|jgi:hypothetical protein
MGAQQPEQQRTRRWRYIVDWKPQLTFVAEIVGVLCGVCIAFAVVTFLLVLDRNDATAKLRPEEVWGFLLQITAIFMVVSAVVFVLLSIAISHRFLGPALVIRRAVQAMIDGWYDRRFTLRRRDYLKPLAAKVEELADVLSAREDEQRQIIESLHECLDENELDAARALLERLQDRSPKSKRRPPVPETV